MDFFKRRIEQAAEYRERRGVNPRLHRVIWSESDGLPGVILDRYGEELVVQLTTLAMDQRKQTIADAICESLGAKILIERDDAVVRRVEGLELVTAVLRGFALETELELCGVKFRIDPLKAQKTGFYLDQVPHYSAVAELAPPRISDALTFVIELLAAVPSVIFGLLGIFVLVPALRNGVEPFVTWRPTSLGTAARACAGMVTATARSGTMNAARRMCGRDLPRVGAP